MVWVLPLKPPLSSTDSESASSRLTLSSRIRTSLAREGLFMCAMSSRHEATTRIVGKTMCAARIMKKRVGKGRNIDSFGYSHGLQSAVCDVIRLEGDR